MITRLIPLLTLAALSVPAHAGTLNEVFKSKVLCPECEITPGLIFSEPTEIEPPGPHMLRDALRRTLSRSDKAVQIVQIPLGASTLGLLGQHEGGRGGAHSWELAGIVDLDGDGVLDFVWGTLSSRGKKFAGALDADLSVTSRTAAAGEVDATLSLVGELGRGDVPGEITEATLSHGGRSESLGAGGTIEITD